MDRRPVNDFPKVLVVSAAPFGNSTGTGITLTNLFNQWPADRLAQLYTMNVVPSAEPCSRYYRYSPRNAPIDYGMRRMLGGSARGLGQGAPAIAAVGRSGPVGISIAAHRQMRAAADLSAIRTPSSLKKWVKDYDPDIIYSILGSVRIIRLATRVAKLCGKPMAPHFMDDWPSTLYSSGELLGYAKKAVDSSLNDVVKRSRQGICISQVMASEYEGRYGLPFSAFANCVADSEFSEPTAPSADNAPLKALDIAYVGGLHLGRAELLRDVAISADSLRDRGLAVTVSIYAPDEELRRHKERFAGVPAARLIRSLAKDEVAGVLRRADVLVHVESFDEDVKRYTRLSLSTKIPQYMAAGRPILGFGPANLASMAHIVSAGAGVVVGNPGADDLTRALTGLCKNDALRYALGLAGHRFAQLHHSRESVARQFSSVLRTASEGPTEAT